MASLQALSRDTTLLNFHPRRRPAPYAPAQLRSRTAAARCNAQRRSEQDDAPAGWRQRAAAPAAATLLSAQALLLGPLDAAAASTSFAAVGQQQQQQQQAAAAAPGISPLPTYPDPDAALSLPPLPSRFPALPPLEVPKYLQVQEHAALARGSLAPTIWQQRD